MAQGKILIVDDDVDITEAMRVVLENSGYTVNNATDSEAGMASIKADKPDLIILDVMMRSSQEGFVMSRDLKANDDTKDIPILMLSAVKDKTGTDFKSEAGDAAWLPVNAFLDKPVKPNVLIQKVEELLQG